MNISLFKERRRIWRIGIFCIEKIDDVFDLDSRTPLIIFGENGLRKGSGYCHTYADPFLYKHNGLLYLFYETKTDFAPGIIEAKSLDSSGVWRDHGAVIREKFHVSYPQVFSHQGRVFMVPEAAESGCVWLYEGIGSPLNWRRKRALIDNALKDPSVFIDERGVFILGSTTEDGLSLYFGDDFESEFKCIQVGITRDARHCRNAGRLFEVDGKLYRPFQDCSRMYGESVGLALVESMTQFRYAETIILDRVIKKNSDWMLMAHHHISIADHNGRIFVALDGMRLDCYLNTLIFAGIRFCRILRDFIRKVFSC